MILQRDSQDTWASFGTMHTDAGTVECQTLERPWIGNHQGISCIPAASYTCSLRFSPHHGFAVFGVDDVPDRSDIEIHAANLPTQLLGCIALGQSRGTLDEHPAIMASQAAIDAFMTARGCAEYRTLTTDALVQAWIAAHPEGSRFTLTVRDPGQS